MKKLFAVCLTLTLCFMSCKDASDKINTNNNVTPASNTTKTTNNNNNINAQIVENDGQAAFTWTNAGATVWDFGTIKQNESREFTFTFKNSGTEPMIISNAKGSCGCTVPKYPKEPIAPGEEGEINVKFNAGTKKGTQNKKVTITANTTPPTTILRVNGNIEVPQ